MLVAAVDYGSFLNLDRSFFVAFSHLLQFFPDLLHSMLCIKIYRHVVYAVELILTIGILREFVMSLKVIMYAKQTGAQMATFAATGTSADIDDLRKTMAALGTRLGGNVRYPRLKEEVSNEDGRCVNRGALHSMEEAYEIFSEQKDLH